MLQKRNEELDSLLDIVEADFEVRFAWASRMAMRFSQNRAAVYDVLERWLDYWRDLMLVKLGRYDIVVNVDRKDELEALAGHFRLAQITDFINSLQSAAEHLRQNVNAQLALEVLVLDIPKKEGGAVLT
jgi:DNA polymerase-3 subunit delta'